MVMKSMSEGDNSVFSEGGTTPMDPNAAAVGDEKQEDNASGNESEEVDDIELIFTTDESKDMSNLQEDLVSIREGDQWAPQSASTAHSTPVLIKFHTLDPDFQPGPETKDSTENQENTDQPLVEISKQKRVSLPNDKEIRHVAFNGKGSLDLPGRSILKSCDNRSDNMLYRKSPNTSTRRLDSIDSLTCEYNRGLSFDNTKSSSFELGSSMDILHREESVDSFHRNIHLGHRYSVFAETDISKCGTSEDDLAANLNVRRNTCPNPFQYRPSNYRGVSRPPGPFKAGSARVRPVLRDSAYARRDSGAQTDVCALPPRWSSDGYLAHKIPVPTSSAATVAPRGASGPRRLTVPDARPPPPARRTDETRRVLLSDIGFTSMVPELSRSADPVWALSKRPSHPDDSTTTSTSKFLSRGSSYRSPCLSIDRSNDWTPQHVYLPRDSSRPWRSSLPDVRRDDTDELLEEAEIFVRRSIDNLQAPSIDLEKSIGVTGTPYIPAEPRHLRLGHTVKVITPHGRIAVGRVRYVGVAGGSAATSSVVVGTEVLHTQQPGLPRNDGLHRGRRYFLTPPLYTALFVPFSKVVMAWTN
uniref:CAP-Gly domain-containing protein n=1 Tax=Heliothis virescens TaxID=7102 RepID=A0A2A4J675_HELVI